MAIVTTQEERALLKKVVAKDRRAFEALYQRYYRRLFGYLWKITRRPEIVEEVVNDVMLTVWQSASRFDENALPSSWILGIAYRKALKALERLRRAHREPPYEPWEPSEEVGPEQLLVRREMASALGQALAELSPEQRAVVELTYYQGLSYREIAGIVGCPINTVKTRMFHARRRLREVLPAVGMADHSG